MLANREVQSKKEAICLDEAVHEGFSSAYDWYLEWREVKNYDDAHPELFETNDSLMHKVSPVVGEAALKSA